MSDNTILTQTQLALFKVVESLNGMPTVKEILWSLRKTHNLVVMVPEKQKEDELQAYVSEVVGEQEILLFMCGPFKTKDEALSGALTEMLKHIIHQS